MRSSLTFRSLAVGLVFAAAVPAQSGFTVVDLGIPDGRPQDLNDRGQVVGWYRTANQTHAFVHDAATGSWSDPGVLPGAAQASARAINEAGQIVGSSWNAPIEQPGRACVFTPGSGMQDLGVLRAGGRSEAFCIDDFGNVGGQADGSAFTPEAMVVAAGGTMRSVQPGTSGNVLAWTASGWVVGTLGANRAFYTDPTGALQFVPLPASAPIGRATAVSGNGWIAGEMSDASGSPSYAFRFDPSTGRLDNLGSISRFGTVTGVDSRGTVVAIRQASTQSDPVGVISFGGAALVTVDSLLGGSSGWSVLAVSGINEVGQLCGRARRSGGATVPVRLDPTGGGTAAGSSSEVGNSCSAIGLHASWPRTGHLWSMVVTGAAAAQPLHVVLTVGHHAPVTVPGAACSIHVGVGASGGSLAGTANAIGSWAGWLEVPADPSLVGGRLTAQVVAVDSAQPLGVEIGGGLQVVVGG